MKQAHKPILSLLTLLLALFVGVAMGRTTTAQNDQNGQAGQTESGQNQSGQAQNGSQEHKEGHHMTVTGCLEKSTSGSGFQLTDDKTQKVYQLTTASDMDLSAHVGHTVKVTGEQEEAAAGQPAGQGTEQLRVTKVKHVKNTCTPPKTQ